MYKMCLGSIYNVFSKTGNRHGPNTPPCLKHGSNYPATNLIISSECTQFEIWFINRADKSSHVIDS